MGRHTWALLAVFVLLGAEAARLHDSLKTAQGAHSRDNLYDGANARRAAKGGEDPTKGGDTPKTALPPAAPPGGSAHTQPEPRLNASESLCCQFCLESLYADASFLEMDEATHVGTLARAAAVHRRRSPQHYDGEGTFVGTGVFPDLAAHIDDALRTMDAVEEAASVLVEEAAAVTGADSAGSRQLLSTTSRRHRASRKRLAQLAASRTHLGSRRFFGGSLSKVAQSVGAGGGDAMAAVSSAAAAGGGAAMTAASSAVSAGAGAMSAGIGGLASLASPAVLGLAGAAAAMGLGYAGHKAIEKMNAPKKNVTLDLASMYGCSGKLIHNPSPRQVAVRRQVLPCCPVCPEEFAPPRDDTDPTAGGSAPPSVAKKDVPGMRMGQDFNEEWGTPRRYSLFVQLGEDSGLGKSLQKASTLRRNRREDTTDHRATTDTTESPATEAVVVPPVVAAATRAAAKAARTAGAEDISLLQVGFLGSVLGSSTTAAKTGLPAYRPTCCLVCEQSVLDEEDEEDYKAEPVDSEKYDKYVKEHGKEGSEGEKKQVKRLMRHLDITIRPSGCCNSCPALIFEPKADLYAEPHGGPFQVSPRAKALAEAATMTEDCHKKFKRELGLDGKGEDDNADDN